AERPQTRPTARGPTYRRRRPDDPPRLETETLPTTNVCPPSHRMLLAPLRAGGGALDTERFCRRQREVQPDAGLPLGPGHLFCYARFGSDLVRHLLRMLLRRPIASDR